MNKILRLSLIAVLAMVFNVSFAETKIWSEDWTGAKKDQTPAQVNKNYSSENAGTKIYEEALAGGKSPELLVAKKNGSFTATIALNGATGEMTLRYNTNKSLTVSTSTKGVTIGEGTKSGTTVEAKITVSAGTETLTLTFANTSSSNARLDDILLYQGVAKKPAGLSWGTASRTATIGSADNLFPTLTNENKLAVKYSSSDQKVATINEKGEVTLVAAGVTEITAEFAGNDEYEAQSVTYTLTVKAASTVDITNTPETAYTVAKALELIEAGEGLDAKVYVKGIISSIKSVDTAEWGNATYNISDNGKEEKVLVIYRGYYLGAKDNKFTSADQIKVGDKVVVYGKLVNYNGTKEMNSGSYIYSQNDKVASVNAITLDKTNAPLYNLAGQRVSNNYKGVVVKNGKKYFNK